MMVNLRGQERLHNLTASVYSGVLVWLGVWGSTMGSECTSKNCLFHPLNIHCLNSVWLVMYNAMLSCFVKFHVLAGFAVSLQVSAKKHVSSAQLRSMKSLKLNTWRSLSLPLANQSCTCKFRLCTESSHPLASLMMLYAYCICVYKVKFVL